MRSKLVKVLFLVTVSLAPAAFAHEAAGSQTGMVEMMEHGGRGMMQMMEHANHSMCR